MPTRPHILVWLLAVAATLASLPPLAPARADETRSPSPPSSSPSPVPHPPSAVAFGEAYARVLASGATPMAQLEALTKAAPARQVGQPGNEFVDGLIRRRFEDAVAKHNDPARWAQAQDKLKDAASADTAFTQARDTAKVAPEPPPDQLPPLGQRIASNYLEIYWNLTELLAFVTAVLIGAWWFQRRKSLLVVGWVFAAATVVAPVTGLIMQSLREPEKGGNTMAGLEAQVQEAALASWQADNAAAKALAGLWQSGRTTYPTAVFVPGRAEMTLPGGAVVRLYPLAPNLVEPTNLPESGFHGLLVYTGAATPTDLSGRNQSLDGAAALIEFGSSRRWLDTVELGAQVVIVLEPAAASEMIFTEAAQKQTDTPLSVPRFYVKRADLAAALGEDWQQKLAAAGGVQIGITQTQPSVWEAREIAADWLLIPGTAEAPAPDAADAVGGDPSRELIHFQAYKDSRSIVPELSPGAASAGNLVLLLRMLDEYERHPPRRPVLLSVVNDHTNALLGEQEFNSAVFLDAATVLHELGVIENDLAVARFMAGIYGQKPTAELTEALRTMGRDVAGLKLEVKKPLTDRLSVLRNTIRDERTKIHSRLDRDTRQTDPARKLTAADRTALLNRIKQIDDDSDEYLQVIKLFNKFGARSRFDRLSPSEHKRLDDVFAQIAGECRQAEQELLRSRGRLMANLEVRRRLMALSPPVADGTVGTAASVLAKRYRPLPASLAVSLDLAFGADQCGFFFMGNMKKEDDSVANENKDRLTALARYTIQVAVERARQTGRPNRLADTIRGVAGMPWQAYLGGKFAFGADAFFQYQIPGLTLTSIRDMRPYDYTPADAVERIDRENFEALVDFASDYLPQLADSPDLAATLGAAKKFQPLTVDVQARQHDQFAVQIPEVPLRGALVVVCVPAGLQIMPNNARMLGQVRPWLVTFTDRCGTAKVRGSVWRGSSPWLYVYDKSYRKLTAISDLGEWEKRIPTAIAPKITEFYMPRVLVAAELDKVDLIGVTEPLKLSTLDAFTVNDAAQDGMPRHFSVGGVKSDRVAKPVVPSGDGSASVMMEHDVAFKLMVGRGLVINATPENSKGVGFPSDAGMIRNLVLTSARDMWLLTQQRLEMLRDKGVKNETAEDFNAEARKRIDAAESAQKAGRNAQVMVRAEEARGLAYQAYQRGRGTIDDLTKAVVIFLALVIPFCVFVTKLTSPYNDVNRNLALFAGIFVLMAAVLRFVHPAFAVAETPEVVILAFVILGMAGFVMAVLVGRFNSSMTQAVEESQLTESVEAPQSRLAGVAFVVGVNNMKRRRIRTSLTTATIILVTFTMLSVISVGQDVAPATVRVSQSSPYNGFLFARSGLEAIDAVQMQRLRAHFEGRATVASRAWAQRMGAFGDYLGYDLTPERPVEGAAVATLTAKVLVGVEVAEDGLTGKMPVLPGGRWISSDSAAEMLLSVEAAKLLGITPENFQGQRLRVNGRWVDLVGLLDDKRLEAMRDLSDLPLLPTLAQAAQSKRDVANSAAQAAAEAAGSAKLDAGGGLTGPGSQIARPLDVAFVSMGFARSLGEADYRTMSVKYGPSAGDEAAQARAAWEAANDLIQYQYVLVSVGLREPVTPASSNRRVEAGQYTLASSASTQVGGVLKIAIPIILAATIILNTMLGSVMERRREVAIYNAIGLNPGHVMVFFLAESLVFGLVGSVAGYLIGQTLSLVITHFHFLSLNLNYSSLSVMVVIFLTIATVLLSTVYPAMMAARAAVPSGQRRWCLPQPVGDEIYVQFPFSYDAARVLGVCAYLRDYMRQNSEASTGNFLARLGPAGRVPAHTPDGAFTKAYAMLFDVAPAPFDLGVNQRMEVYAYYDARVKAHMLAVHLTRLSGQRGNWVAVNQPFLEALRKRLLGWRSQKTATQQTYFHEGEKLFADAPDLPVVGASAAEPMPERA